MYVRTPRTTDCIVLWRCVSVRTATTTTNNQSLGEQQLTVTNIEKGVDFLRLIGQSPGSW